MSCITIRNCCIGEGKPNVIIPIVEHTEAAILQKAAEFSTLSADCVEWRVDLFELAKDLRAVAHYAAKLRVALKDKLLLVTFRTKSEGGSAALSREEYIRFIHTVLATDCADLIDIEFFTAGADLPGLIEDAHTAGVKVVCSSHDFHKTPPCAELVSRMTAMQEAGADQACRHAHLPGRRHRPAGRDRRDGGSSPGNAGHHHEHGYFGCRQPPVRGGIRFRYDLRKPRRCQRPRSGAAGCGQ